MALTLDEIDEIIRRMPRTERGDAGFELTEEDEQALDKAWAKRAAEKEASDDKQEAE